MKGGRGGREGERERERERTHVRLTDSLPLVVPSVAIHSRAWREGVEREGMGECDRICNTERV